MHVYVRSNGGKLISTTLLKGLMEMADGGDYLKYMTERFVTYLDTPKEQRKQSRSSAKATREPWLTRWFGWGPIGILMWWRGRGQR